MFAPQHAEHRSVRNRGAAAFRSLAAGAVAIAGAYAAHAWWAWDRYGHDGSTLPPDPQLDRFMPEYDVRERHETRIAAPSWAVFAVARDFDLFGLPAVRALFRARALLMGSAPGPSLPGGLAAQLTALGWSRLTEVPGREIAFGTATRPWEARVRFVPVPGEEFAKFAEPDCVQIAVIFRAEPQDAGTLFSTETRARAMGKAARRRFRAYWAAFSPGIILIRLAMLRALKASCEREASHLDAAPGPRDSHPL